MRRTAKYTHLEASKIYQGIYETLCGRQVYWNNIAPSDEASCPKCLIELLIHTLPRPTQETE